MTTVMNLFDNLVNVDLFNKILVKQGGSSIKTHKPQITMRNFIFKLIKTFRKDFNKKKRGGMADIYNDSDISYSTNISDLKFSSYSFPSMTVIERDIY